MRKVRYAVCALLTIAFTACSISSAIAQDQPSEPRNKVVTEEMQKALLKQQVLEQITMDRARFVEGLVGRWVSLTIDKGAELRSTFMILSDDRLADASNADTRDGLNKILFGTEDIGDPSVDLVFTKLIPCRIIDTRLAGGIIAAGTTRNFRAHGSFTSQGGDPGNCGVIGFDPAALVLTIIAADPVGKGNLRAFPKGAAIPNAVAINYTAGFNLANTTIVPLKQDGLDPFEFTISSLGSSSHVVADVVGYFALPAKTPLSCFTQSKSVSIPNNTNWDFQTDACSPLYALTGGGVNWTFACQSNVEFWQNSPNVANDAWRTRGRNTCGSNITITAYARCCSIPGF